MKFPHFFPASLQAKIDWLIRTKYLYSVLLFAWNEINNSATNFTIPWLLICQSFYNSFYDFHWNIISSDTFWEISKENSVSERIWSRVGHCFTKECQLNLINVSIINWSLFGVRRYKKKILFELQLHLNRLLHTLTAFFELQLHLNRLLHTLTALYGWSQIEILIPKKSLFFIVQKHIP